MTKLFSKITFLYYFFIFMQKNKLLFFQDIKYLKRVGNGLSNTFIFKDKYVVKIRNPIRENENIRLYNGSYNNKFFYDVKDKFKKEFDILNVLNNLGLAPIPLEWNKNYLIIEFIESITLAQYLIDTNNYQIFTKLDEHIQVLHKNSIFHGDLNLNNILITTNEDIKFIDFESSFDPKLTFKEKKELEYKIMIEKMERFYPSIYVKYKEYYE